MKYALLGYFLGMSVVLLLLSFVCFVVEVFNGSIGDLDLIALGLAFLVAAMLVGPVMTFVKERT